MIKKNEDLYRLQKKYMSLHHKFRKQVCPSNTLKSFYSKKSKSRGQGYWIPLTINNKIDLVSIKRNLPRIRSKSVFIQGLLSRLEKMKKLPSIDTDLKEIKSLIKSLLDLKKEYYFYEREKSLNLQKSVKGLKQLKDKYEVFLSKVFFLKTFNFPNNHLDNRNVYERLKALKTDVGKKKANLKYLFRRIVEDGTTDRSKRKGDLFLRTTIDSLYYQFEKNEADFLSENIRYDISWVLRVVESHYKRGYKKQIERLKTWFDKNNKVLSFYKSLIENEKRSEVINKKLNASEELKDFVFKKQAETYKFWLNQSEQMRAIFALETILYNEVGRVDGREGLERRDVSQVVINRFSLPKYNYLKKEQSLYKYLDPDNKSFKTDKWLDVLFKEGEFSFTYYYMSAVSHIFCPETSKFAARLRKENLKIVMKKLQNPDNSFKGVRYFSRASMLGKIDMSSVWSDFRPIKPRLGAELINYNKHLRKIKDNDFTYLYPFVGFDGKDYHTVSVGNGTYVLSRVKKRIKLYRYRNPHYFIYFESIN